MKETVFLDPSDRRLLSALQDQPDLTIAELAELAGMSQTPCWRRLKRLQDDGTIRGRVWLLDPARLGLSVNVFAEVRLSSHDEKTLEAFENATRERAEIVECFSMSGQSDYLLRIVVGTVADYERLLKAVLLHLPGVGSINSSFALNSVKISTALPL